MTDLGPVRARVIVQGRVQGVFYRDTCKHVARSFNIKGWIRNCSDGSVEAVFEGDPSAVEQMISWCRRGPDRAQVRDVIVTYESLIGENDFTVR